MYIPKQFQITDTAWCHALMRAQSFAVMITADDAGVPFATHLPILVDPARGPVGTLRGHVARANPHWRYLAAGRPTLVVFAGAHAYVSPSWYATHPSVPTWNYVAVHATGTGALAEESGSASAMQTSSPKCCAPTLPVFVQQNLTPGPPYVGSKWPSSGR